MKVVVMVVVMWTEVRREHTPITNPVPKRVMIVPKTYNTMMNQC